MTLHVTEQEQAVFKRFLETNNLIGQITPSFTTNTRTKPKNGLLVSVDFVVAEYNLACDGALTREQVYSVLRKLDIEPYGQPLKPYGQYIPSSRRVLELATT